uniref:Uncharacterized protein n=1 Tax=Cacopsylla melanoneura TaxID=428564 RepID=A0A8D8Q0H0_9HEMI
MTFKTIRFLQPFSPPVHAKSTSKRIRIPTELATRYSNLLIMFRTFLLRRESLPGPLLLDGPVMMTLVLLTGSYHKDPGLLVIASEIHGGSPNKGIARSFRVENLLGVRVGVNIGSWSRPGSGWRRGWSSMNQSMDQQG